VVFDDDEEEEVVAEAAAGDGDFVDCLAFSADFWPFWSSSMRRSSSEPPPSPGTVLGARESEADEETVTY
jgi:hypothetical protein